MKNELKIESCTGVYKPAEDSYLLLGALECGKKVLEVGCGSGIISVSCALQGSNVEAVDINRLAVECTLRNALLNQVEVSAYVSDLFVSVPRDSIYDTIIFNPPYLPTDDRVGGSEQWDGGEDGFRLTRPFLEGAGRHLSEGGRIYIILSSLTDNSVLMREFPELGFEEMGKEEFFFEKIFVYRITPKRRDNGT